jgi:5-methylcytosine-specific restriction protein B
MNPVHVKQIEGAHNRLGEKTHTMALEDRQNDFRRAVEVELAIPLHHSQSTGFSNGARFIEGAFFVGRPNLDTGIAAGAQGLSLLSVVFITEGIETHVAALVRDGLEDLRRRLDSMIAAHGTQLNHSLLGTIQPYSERNNNVSFYLYKDGSLYTTSRSPVRLVDDELVDLLGLGIRVDHLYYAVYPPTLAAKNHPSLTGFIEDVRSILGSDRVSELFVWPTQPALLESMFHMPATMDAAEITRRVQALGGVYTNDILDSFHVGLNFLEDKHFVILTGLSGTGKTSLVRRYAHAVHGLDSLDVEDPLFFLCPVRPDWTDPLGLMGHFDVFTGRYIVPTFLRAVLTANAYQNCPVFVCLDELNLARVEYYFSDVLSAMETGLPLTLHSHDVSVPSDLGVLVPPSIPWPHNLFIVGTVNVDETTHTISDKVLDRAQRIDTSQTNFQPLFDQLTGESPQLAWSVERCGQLLTQINEILFPHGMGIGYRVVSEVIRYHGLAVARGDELRSTTVIDQQLKNKVLVKLKGTERQREMLLALQQAVAPYPGSVILITRLLEDLAEGWFQATR